MFSRRSHFLKCTFTITRSEAAEWWPGWCNCSWWWWEDQEATPRKPGEKRRRFCCGCAGRNLHLSILLF